jgi:hypothetical protein
MKERRVWDLKSMKYGITKEITSVDVGGEDMVRGFQKGRYEPSVQIVPSRSRDQQSRSIAGIGGVQTLKI